jgi:hypothetical protein
MQESGAGHPWRQPPDVFSRPSVKIILQISARRRFRTDQPAPATSVDFLDGGPTSHKSLLEGHPPGPVDVSRRADMRETQCIL